MTLVELQEKIEKLHQEKEAAVRLQEGQGRGIPLAIIKGKQEKIASRYDREIAALELKKRHLLERESTMPKNDPAPFINIMSGADNCLIEDCDFEGNRPTVKTQAKGTRLNRVRHFGQKAKEHPTQTIAVGLFITVIGGIVVGGILHLLGWV